MNLGLWRRLKWDWPEDETQACWWIANYGDHTGGTASVPRRTLVCFAEGSSMHSPVGDEDKTKEVKLVCRSMACTRMELHQSRLATSAKLRAEWDRRLENNAVAVDVLNSNRQLWMTAGGVDPETLVSPTEPSLDHCARTVQLLRAMLQKHGPRGGLDSFVQDIEGAVQMMKVVSHALSSVQEVALDTKSSAWLFHSSVERYPATTDHSVCQVCLQNLSISSSHLLRRPLTPR